MALLCRDNFLKAMKRNDPLIDVYFSLWSATCSIQDREKWTELLYMATLANNYKFVKLAIEKGASDFMTGLPAFHFYRWKK